MALGVFFTICQVVNAQNFCYTPADAPDIMQSFSANTMVTANDTYQINVFFHIVCKTNGTGGFTVADANNAFSIINNDYNNLGISFCLSGIDEIKDDNVYNRTSFGSDYNGDGKFDNFSPNSHSNAIDIYLYPVNKLNFGLASGIPGTALVIGGSMDGIPMAISHVLSHELGHCLGLYHTFHGICEQGCPELVNGSNASTCGDFVSDTPADPKTFNLNSNCEWNGNTCNGRSTDANGNHYQPNNHLIMAYVPPTCMEYHTDGQGIRMSEVKTLTKQISKIDKMRLSQKRISLLLL